MPAFFLLLQTILPRSSVFAVAGSDQEVFLLPALGKIGGHPARRFATAGPLVVGIGRIAILRRDHAGLLALLRCLGARGLLGDLARLAAARCRSGNINA